MDHLRVDADLADGAHDGESSAAQIEKRILPIADHPFVDTDAALPPNGRSELVQ
jgi:hypothetical protein